MNQKETLGFPFGFSSSWMDLKLFPLLIRCDHPIIWSITSFPSQMILISQVSSAFWKIQSAIPLSFPLLSPSPLPLPLPLLGAGFLSDLNNRIATNKKCALEIQNFLNVVIVVSLDACTLNLIVWFQSLAFLFWE